MEGGTRTKRRSPNARAKKKPETSVTTFLNPAKVSETLVLENSCMAEVRENYGSEYA